MSQKNIQIFVIVLFVIFFSNFIIVPEIYGLKAEGKAGWKYGSTTEGIVWGDRLCSEIDKEEQEISTLQITNYLAPLKQIKAGINAEDVICKNEFTLLLKTSDNQPVCVKIGSVSKLIDRGWATLLENFVIHVLQVK